MTNGRCHRHDPGTAGGSLRPAPRYERKESAPTKQAVLLLGQGYDWPPELLASLVREGYLVDRIPELELAPSLLIERGVRALLVVARPLAANELLTLRRCRHVSPATAIVVFTASPTQPDLKRALESGATAFLSWPASADALRRALGSGVYLAPLPSPKEGT